MKKLVEDIIKEIRQIKIELKSLPNPAIDRFTVSDMLKEYLCGGKCAILIDVTERLYSRTNDLKVKNLNNILKSIKSNITSFDADYDSEPKLQSFIYKFETALNDPNNYEGEKTDESYFN